MSTLTSLISGGGGGGGGPTGLPELIPLTVSCTYVPSVSFSCFVYVLGAGGGGGGSGYYFGTETRSASGGGSGGLAVSQLSLIQGISYTAVIGTTSNNTGVTFNGYTGGNSSFSGPDITTLIGYGGGAGQGRQGWFEYPVSPGAAGGGATGGNIFNLTGFSSGANPPNYSAASTLGLFTLSSTSVNNGFIANPFNLSAGGNNRFGANSSPTSTTGYGGGGNPVVNYNNDERSMTGNRGGQGLIIIVPTGILE